MTDLSILNLHKVHGKGWEVRSDIKEAELRWMQHLMSRCVPVLSSHPDFLNDWCVEWTGAVDLDGYARHKPPKDLDGSKQVDVRKGHRAVRQSHGGSCLWQPWML